MQSLGHISKFSNSKKLGFAEKNYILKRKIKKLVPDLKGNGNKAKRVDNAHDLYFHTYFFNYFDISFFFFWVQVVFIKRYGHQVVWFILIKFWIKRCIYHCTYLYIFIVLLSLIFILFYMIVEETA